MNNIHLTIRKFYIKNITLLNFPLKILKKFTLRI